MGDGMNSYSTEVLNKVFLAPRQQNMLSDPKNLFCIRSDHLTDVNPAQELGTLQFPNCARYLHDTVEFEKVKNLWRQYSKHIRDHCYSTPAAGGQIRNQDHEEYGREV